MDLNLGFVMPETVNNCVNESASLIAQCDAHAQSVLYAGLIVGCIAGAAGMYIGMWYYGRKS